MKTTYDKMAIGSMYSYQDTGHPRWVKVGEGISRSVSDPEGALAGFDYRLGIDDPSKIEVFYYGSNNLRPKT